MVAQISQETNTFNPVLTTIDDFSRNNLVLGAEIMDSANENGVIGGFLTTVEADAPNRKLAPVMSAQAIAGGRLSTECLAFLEDKLISGLKSVEHIDAVFLSMHGAMAAENIDDVEGYLLKAIREEMGKQVPLVVALDHHANITGKMIKYSNFMLGHQTQPHNLFDTGKKTGKVLFKILDSGVKLSVAWKKIPMIAPQDQFLTSEGPMKEWFDMARALEKNDEVLSISLFPMQPWLDVAEGGWSALVYTNNDPKLADSIAMELADKAWELKEEFWRSDRVALEEAIKKAEQAECGLVILSDTGDAVYGGATGDGSCLIKEMLNQQIEGTALVPLIDPEVLEEAIKAGIGAEITISVYEEMDSSYSTPLKITGTVKTISEQLEAKIGCWSNVKIGRTVLLEIGAIKLVLMEDKNYAINHPVLYENLGLDVSKAKMVVLKTGSNFQFFEPWKKALIRVDSPGTTQSDLTGFEWTHLPRPIYPLDELKNWR